MQLYAKETTEWLLDEAKQAGADHADVLMMDVKNVSVSCRNGKQDNLERSESAGVSLRVWAGESVALVSSSDLAKETLKSLVQQAYAMAKASTPNPHQRLADSALLAHHFDDLDIYDAQDVTLEKMFANAIEAESTALATQGITNSEGADASTSVYVISLASSDGFSEAYQASMHALSASVIAGEGVTMQRDYEYSSARHFQDLLTPDIIGKNAAQRALARLNPVKKTTGKYPIVLNPRVGKQLLSAFASGINGSSVARGTSFLQHAMGTTIFDKHVHIIDDATRKRGIASRPFDGEGVLCAPLHIVSQGVLQSWLLDMRTASQLNLKSTGHASRGITSSPSPSSTNLYMQAGSISVEDMIADIKEGFYVTETFGMGVNTVTGDYSQGASGFWIENGEIVYPVSEMTIAGHLLEMFKQITPANDLVFKYATNTPTLRIESMTVAGN